MVVSLKKFLTKSSGSFKHFAISPMRMFILSMAKKIIPNENCSNMLPVALVMGSLGGQRSKMEISNATLEIKISFRFRLRLEYATTEEF